ncbi:MAG: ABC transporter substrate-binding protein, partial [Anaerolineae bacterium]
MEVAHFTQTFALGGERTDKPFTITVVDDLGREVEIPYPPKRVAATVSFQVELLMTLGYRPVLRPNIPEQYIFPPEAKEIPTVQISHRAGPNLEQLAAAEPDLVITSPTFAQFVPSIEETLGVPVLVYDIAGFDDVVEKIRTFGLLVGRQAEAEEVAADLQAQLTALRQGLPEEGPRVFALFGTSESFLGFMPDSYLGNLVELLGGQLITRGDEPHQRFRTFTPFSLETVVARDPDIIFIVRHGAPSPEREENIEELQQDPAWSSITA